MYYYQFFLLWTRFELSLTKTYIVFATWLGDMSNFPKIDALTFIGKRDRSPNQNPYIIFFSKLQAPKLPDFTTFVRIKLA